MSDKSLRLKIIKALDGERLIRGERIGVAAEHAEVTLFGKVASERERQLAVGLASAVKQARSIRDLLEIAPPAPAPSPLYDHDKTYQPPFAPLHLEIEEAVGRYEAREPQRELETWFEAFAENLVLPIFADVLNTARRAGHDGQVLHRKDRDAHVYRLELLRADHPTNQPAPYLELSPAETGHRVTVARGGAYPGPTDHNFLDAEMTWDDVEPRAVQKEVVRWVKRVFRNYD
ncbi:MAG: BON domain-containing protein [Caulobacter sp.]